MDQGRRGAGGQVSAASVWGLPVSEYLERGDVWPLNPRGEIMLGLKIENQRALANAEESTRIPGVAFAEWGPGDMGMSLGYRDAHDPPYPEEMTAARERVKKACKQANVAFLDGVSPNDVVERIEEGVRVCSGGREAAEIGRKHTGRSMPW